MHPRIFVDICRAAMAPERARRASDTILQLAALGCLGGIR